MGEDGNFYEYIGFWIFSDFLKTVANMMASLATVVVVVVLILYIILASFLNKFHKRVYGSAMTWIPFVNTYLLGKLSINEVCGWVLLLIQLLGMGIILEDYVSLFSKIVVVLFLILLVYSIFKYYRIESENALNNSLLSIPYDNMLNGKLKIKIKI